MSQPAPEGFAPHARKSRVTDPWEPLYSRQAGNTVQIGVWLREEHCNSRGFVHGGVIATLADNAMGLTYGLAAKASGHDLQSAVTLTLSVDYAAAARVGQWLQVEPRAIKAGRSIGFMDALIAADGATIARASATFRPL